jgi:hypothetical protein
MNLNGFAVLTRLLLCGEGSAQNHWCSFDYFSYLCFESLFINACLRWGSLAAGPQGRFKISTSNRDLLK